MNAPPIDYKHDDWIAGHGDVLKHVVLTTVLSELQDVHPEGVLLVDCMAGDGVYDLNQHSNPKAYQKGIVRLLEKVDKDPSKVPEAVANFVDQLKQVTGCTGAADLDVYPGSPVWGQNLLRKRVDEHRLIDLHVEEVQWLGNHADFITNVDAFSPEALEFLMPYTEGGKHPILLLDPDYQDDADFGKVKKFVSTVLDQNPYATIMLWMPYIHNHKFRFSFPTQMRALAKTECKTGRYFCSTQVGAKEFQGSCVLVCNPTRNLDEVLDDTCIHWLANTMNMGKDEYMVEQTNKKKKAATN